MGSLCFLFLCWFKGDLIWLSIRGRWFSFPLIESHIKVGVFTLFVCGWLSPVSVCMFVPHGTVAFVCSRVPVRAFFKLYVSSCPGLFSSFICFVVDSSIVRFLATSCLLFCRVLNKSCHHTSLHIGLQIPLSSPRLRRRRI